MQHRAARLFSFGEGQNHRGMGIRHHKEQGVAELFLIAWQTGVPRDPMCQRAPWLVNIKACPVRSQQGEDAADPCPSAL
jgi:hypothetical protein